MNKNFQKDTLSGKKGFYAANYACRFGMKCLMPIRFATSLKASVVRHLSKLSYLNPLSPIIVTSIQILPNKF